ncbi:MAG: UV DNA damage repair endonuclease UvsE [Dehalococcoidia bacterium]|nr:UV DNA damage repair endonuclease UvsE [Dehalococcoidia bacterium]
MKIGYPCINRTLGCTGDRTFRLKSYSEERLVAAVANNLDCLMTMLRFNADHNMLFFRITSDLVPFASHPVNRFDWKGRFGAEFEEAGAFIREHDIRISMHPDQFTVINSPDPGVSKRSIRELLYHADVLDSMALDTTARIQIHVGGVYGDRDQSIRRFESVFRELPVQVKRRLAVENDDRLYGLRDCLSVSRQTGIPVIFDTLHHGALNSGEDIETAVEAASRTWTTETGMPMVDYSSQRVEGRRGRHVESIDLEDFALFLETTKPYDFDIMLEIKDKEESALKAVQAARRDPRFIHTEQHS